MALEQETIVLRLFERAVPGAPQVSTLLSISRESSNYLGDQESCYP